ncbi:MAG TPA: hypothetical protein VFH13_07065 [Gemmatimonadaceae bacterium]|nr:hypothetical protein [Gemmatimonadaceae bacterium]
MLSASVFLVVWIIVTQMETGSSQFTGTRLYYALRLIGALLVATLVPLLIDRRARRSSRVRR